MTFIETQVPYEFETKVVKSAQMIAFNPLLWNAVAQLEFRYKPLTRLTGSKFRGCYLLAISIFSLGILRDWLYERALSSQPEAPLLASAGVKAAGIGLFATGNILVLSSMLALGITGTYMGDYFGILKNEKLTSFPFNVCDNPMYVGSFLSFLGTALYFGKVMGILLSCFVWVMYYIALKLEEPFTARIYAERDFAREEARKKNL